MGVIWCTSVLLGQGSLTTTGRGWQGLPSLTASAMCSAEQLLSLWTLPSWAAARSNHHHHLIVLLLTLFYLSVHIVCTGYRCLCCECEGPPALRSLEQLTTQQTGASQPRHNNCWAAAGPAWFGGGGGGGGYQQSRGRAMVITINHVVCGGNPRLTRAVTMVNG